MRHRNRDTRGLSAMVPMARETVNVQVSERGTKGQEGGETLGERGKEEGGKCWGRVAVFEEEFAGQTRTSN